MIERRVQARSRLWSGDYLATEPLREDLSRALAPLTGRVLDVGCGNRPYEPLLPPGVRYVACDPDPEGSRPHVVALANRLPFTASSFDAVICTQVLEHVESPEGLLTEIRSVLRPGGRLVLTAPQHWRIHEAPRDFFRFTRYGLEHLLASADFVEVAITPQGGVWRLVGQAVNNAVHERFGRTRLANLAYLAVNVMALGLERVWLDSGDTLNYLACARRADA